MNVMNQVLSEVLNQQEKLQFLQTVVDQIQQTTACLGQDFGLESMPKANDHIQQVKSREQVSTGFDNDNDAVTAASDA